MYDCLIEKIASPVLLYSYLLVKYDDIVVQNDFSLLNVSVNWLSLTLYWLK